MKKLKLVILISMAILLNLNAQKESLIHKTSIDKYVKLKFNDEKFGWYFDALENKYEFDSKHKKSSDLISLILLNMKKELDEIKASAIHIANSIINEDEGSQISEQGDHELNKINGLNQPNYVLFNLIA